MTTTERTPMNDPAPHVERQRYRDTLNSARWKGLRDYAVAASDGLCTVCWRRPATELHHLTYEHVGREGLNEVRPICSDCHRWTTKAAETWERFTAHMDRNHAGRKLDAVPETSPVGDAWVNDFVTATLTRDAGAALVFDASHVAWSANMWPSLAGSAWVRFSTYGEGIVWDTPDVVRPDPPPPDRDERLTRAAFEFVARCQVEGWELPTLRPVVPVSRPARRTDRTGPPARPAPRQTFYRRRTVRKHP